MLAGGKSRVINPCHVNNCDICSCWLYSRIAGHKRALAAVESIEARIMAMIDIWGIDAFADLPAPQANKISGEEALMSGPQLSGAGISQDDISAMFD